MGYDHLFMLYYLTVLVHIKKKLNPSVLVASSL